MSKRSTWWEHSWQWQKPVAESKIHTRPRHSQSALLNWWGIQNHSEQCHPLLHCCQAQPMRETEDKIFVDILENKVWTPPISWSLSALALTLRNWSLSAWRGSSEDEALLTVSGEEAMFCRGQDPLEAMVCRGQDHLCGFPCIWNLWPALYIWAQVSSCVSNMKTALPA